MRRALVPVLALAAIVAPSCSSDDGGGDAGDAAPSVSGTPGEVCSGTGFSSSTTDEGTVAIYLDEGSGFAFDGYPDIESMQPIIPDEAAYIVCLTLTSSEVVDQCEFEEDGEEFTLELADASFDVELREAASADVIETTTLDLEADECPMITSFESGEGSRVDYPDLGDSLTPLLESNV